MYELSVKHMLGIKGLNPNDINLIFDVAKNFKEVISRPIKKVPTLRDITIANLFFENSTRTKLSFELAEKRLSADVLNFSSSNSSLSKGESLIDTVNNILAMKVDMVVIRHPDPGVAYFLSKNVDSVIINAGDGAHEHPTQALLDSYSINEKLGTIKGKNILIVGDIKHSRVALSNIFCLQKMGANVRVCAPPTLVPKNINDLNVEVSYNLEESLNWCDVANVLRIQLERQNLKYFPSLREYSMLYGLDKKLLSRVKKETIIMHPGPINRGVEITSDLVDCDQSIILNQVENGVAVRMAILYLLAEKLKKLNNAFRKKDIFTYIIFQNSDKIEELKNKIEITLSESDNLIIDIQNININKEKLVLSFLNYHSLWKKINKSFILVLNDSKIDFDNEIVCLPTLNEAVEYLFMDELERNV